MDITQFCQILHGILYRICATGCDRRKKSHDYLCSKNVIISLNSPRFTNLNVKVINYIILTSIIENTIQHLVTSPRMWSYHEIHQVYKPQCKSYLHVVFFYDNI